MIYRLYNIDLDNFSRVEYIFWLIRPGIELDCNKLYKYDFTAASEST